MICPDCNDSDDANCFRCDGTGRVCDSCGEACDEPGEDTCHECAQAEGEAS